MECSAPHSSTPRRISTAHGLSRPLNTRSISPERRWARCPLRGYWCWASSCSTRARVVGATSGLPFTTLDTVGSDTPASAAIAARVVLGTATPFRLDLDIYRKSERHQKRRCSCCIVRQSKQHENVRNDAETRG